MPRRLSPASRISPGKPPRRHPRKRPSPLSSGRPPRPSRLRLRRNFCRSLHHFINQLFEVFQAWRWDDDGVATSAYVFGDAEETTTRILLQGELEGFTLDLNLFRAQGVFVHRGFG